MENSSPGQEELLTPGKEFWTNGGNVRIIKITGSFGGTLCKCGGQIYRVPSSIKTAYEYDCQSEGKEKYIYMKNIGREDTRRYQGKDTKKWRKRKVGKTKNIKSERVKYILTTNRYSIYSL